MVFKGNNSDFDGTWSVTYFPIEEKKMQLCGLVWCWPVGKLWAEYLNVWLQKVNDMCISIAVGALWGNTGKAWPAGEADQALSDADPPSLKGISWN